MGNNPSNMKEYTPEQWRQYNEHLKLQERINKTSVQQPVVQQMTTPTGSNIKQPPTLAATANNFNRTQIKTVNKNFEMKPQVTHKTQLPNLENNLQDHYNQRMRDNIHIGGKTVPQQNGGFHHTMAPQHNLNGPMGMLHQSSGVRVGLNNQMGQNVLSDDYGDVSEMNMLSKYTEDGAFSNNPFKKQQLDNFIKNQEEAKRQFDRDQQKRRDQFYNELKEVENLNYEPEQVLGLDKIPNYTEHDIKLAYKRLAMRYHPDKGGNAEMFKLLTKAYLYLVKKHTESNYVERGHHDLRSQYQNGGNGNVGSDMSSSEKDFDVSYFNKLFDENKLEDVDNEGGYGDWIKEERTSRQPKFFSEKFNLDVFNRVFEETDDSEQQVTEIDVYREPEILPSGAMDYSEVDYKKSADYTKNNVLNSQAGLQYTDLKQAHSNNRLINPNKVSVKQYKDVDELERVRDTQDFTLTDKDREYLESKKRLEEETERERQARLKRRDYQLETHSQKVNGLIANTKLSAAKQIQYNKMAPVQL